MKIDDLYALLQEISNRGVPMRGGAGQEGFEVQEFNGSPPEPGSNMLKDRQSVELKEEPDGFGMERVGGFDRQDNRVGAEVGSTLDFGSEEMIDEGPFSSRALGAVAGGMLAATAGGAMPATARADDSGHTEVQQQAPVDYSKVKDGRTRSQLKQLAAMGEGFTQAQVDQLSNITSPAQLDYMVGLFRDQNQAAKAGKTNATIKYNPDTGQREVQKEGLSNNEDQLEWREVSNDITHGFEADKDGYGLFRVIDFEGKWFAVLEPESGTGFDEQTVEVAEPYEGKWVLQDMYDMMKKNPDSFKRGYLSHMKNLREVNIEKDTEKESHEHPGLVKKYGKKIARQIAIDHASEKNEALVRGPKFEEPTMYLEDFFNGKIKEEE